MKNKKKYMFFLFVLYIEFCAHCHHLLGPNIQTLYRTGEKGTPAINHNRYIVLVIKGVVAHDMGDCHTFFIPIDTMCMMLCFF